jgi:uncharacterized protein
VRALVLSGHEEFGDAWHDLAATSGQLADILDRVGFHVEVRADVSDTLAQLPAVGLLVFNCSGAATGRGSPAVLPLEAASGLIGYLASGRGLLAMHSTVMSFSDWPPWGALLGARWQTPDTMHPPRALAHIQVRTGTHPIVEGISDFDTDDERYSFLELAAPFVTLAEHRHDGQLHPLAWARTAGPGTARVVYDGLGHDLAAYASPEHRELVRRAAQWAARLPPTGARFGHA